MIISRTKKPTILFIGINPHPGSYRRGTPFSNNKLFWYLLSRAGIVPDEREELRNDLFLHTLYAKRFNQVYELGFTNIIARPTPSVAGLKRGEEIPGRKRIARILEREKPIVVCFIGKITYERYTGVKGVTFGWQESEKSSKVFVMHAPLRGEAIIRVRELQKIKRVITRSKK